MKRYNPHKTLFNNDNDILKADIVYALRLRLELLCGCGARKYFQRAMMPRVGESITISCFRLNSKLASEAGMGPCFELTI